MSVPVARALALELLDAVIADSQGATIAIWQSKEHKGTAAGGQYARPGWCELATKDAGKTKESCGKRFGWKLDTKNHRGMEYADIMTSCCPIGTCRR